MTTEACEAIAGAGCSGLVTVNCAGDLEVEDEDLATCVSEDGPCAQFWLKCISGDDCTTHRGPFSACDGLPGSSATCTPENEVVVCDDPCSGLTPCDDCP